MSHPSYGCSTSLGLCEFLGPVFTLIKMQPELLSAAASTVTAFGVHACNTDVKSRKSPNNRGGDDRTLDFAVVPSWR